MNRLSLAISALILGAPASVFAQSDVPTSTTAVASSTVATSSTATSPSEADSETKSPVATRGATVAPASSEIDDNGLGRPDDGLRAAFSDIPIDTIDITARKAAPITIGGSAHSIGAEELERFEYDDIHRVLGRVPGVYVRGEDGYGLRPNIGLRGTSSDRSAKVTLMEDGVLFGPAPYSAPAAYYFPIMTRMVGVEVIKGPGAVKYGPNTIGGALDLTTRLAPDDGLAADVDIAVGVDRIGKGHGQVGYGTDRWGVLLEGVHLQTDGFKELANGDDTGFQKNELMLKAHYQTDPKKEVAHRFSAKLGYSDEESRETYLGLTEDDFRANPYLRYPSSQRGFMEWQRTQAQLTYELTTDELEIKVDAYRHDFYRAWTKLNRFVQGPDLVDILANPDSRRNQIFYSVLTGSTDSEANTNLLIGTNARDFISQGITAVATWRPDWGFEQTIQVGARFHFDRIERTHTEVEFAMQNATLVPTGVPTSTTTRNRGSANAFALFVRDELKFGDLEITPGIRMEIIETTFLNRLADTRSSSVDIVFIPGLGAYYQATKWLGVLAGVHRGFSSVAPGQGDTVDPETSVNYEVGARIGHGKARFEAIGFFNDYSNLIGNCTISGGCPDTQVGAQNNGGEVNVFGLELSGGYELSLPEDMKLSIDLSYTLTQSEFQTSFDSPLPQFGQVEAGDALAYVPVHQASGNVGLLGRTWGAFASVRATGTMRDVAGQGDIDDGSGSDAFVVVDLVGNYQVSEPGQLYVKIDNLLDTAYVVSRRPFGARPGKPFQAMIGYKHHFGK